MMLAILLEKDDSRLEETFDFELHTVTENGSITKTDWAYNSTFNKVFEALAQKHKKGVEITVLDYEGELRGIVTPKAESVKNHYVVMAY